MKFLIENLCPGMMVNPKIIEQVVKEDLAWNEVFARIWELEKSVDIQEFADSLNNFSKQHVTNMLTWWQLQCGKPMNSEQKCMVFGKPKIYAKLTVISMFIESLEGLVKTQNLANLLGLKEFGPIVANKNSRGIRNGGKKRASLMKEEKIKLQKKCKTLYEGYQQRSPNLSPHQIHGKIAVELNLSSSHIYKILKNYQQHRKK